MSTTKSTELIIEHFSDGDPGPFHADVWLSTGGMERDGICLGTGEHLLDAFDSAIEELEGQLETLRSMRRATREPLGRCISACEQRRQLGMKDDPCAVCRTDRRQAARAISEQDIEDAVMFLGLAGARPEFRERMRAALREAAAR
jgi:hypothetical protein